MKRLFVILVICILVTGCGKADRWVAGMTGGASKACVDGVEYLQFTSGATVAYNTDGTIKTCED